MSELSEKERGFLSGITEIKIKKIYELKDFQIQRKVDTSDGIFSNINNRRISSL